MYPTMKRAYNVTITLRVTANDAAEAEFEAWDYMDTAAMLIDRENVFDAIVIHGRTRGSSPDTLAKFKATMSTPEMMA